MKVFGTKRSRLLLGLLCVVPFFLYLLHLRRPDYQSVGKPIKSWVSQLYSAPDQRSRVEAAQFLREMGTNGVASLAELLSYRDSFSRTVLWQNIPRLPARCRAFIASRVRPPARVEYRAGAARALGLLGTNAACATPSVARAMGDSALDVRREAVITMARIGPAAVPFLLKALGTAHADIRPTIAWALGEIGVQAESAVPSLQRAFGERDTDLKLAAAHSLFRIGALPVLIDALRDPQTENRLLAARVLVGLYPSLKAPVNSLVSLATDSDPSVRQKSIEILGGVPYRDAIVITVLTNALHDHSIEVQIAAMNIPNPSIFGDSGRGDLDLLLQDPSPAIRAAARQALTRAGKPLPAPAVLQ